MTATDHTTDQAVARQGRSSSSSAEARGSHKPRGPGLRRQLIEYPALSLFGAVLAVLLGFVLTTSNLRINETNDRISEGNDRFTNLEYRLDRRVERIEDRMERLDTRMGNLEIRMAELETRMDTLETRMTGLETRVGRLEEDVAEIKGLLTGLIAVLDKTEEVEATLAG